LEPNNPIIHCDLGALLCNNGRTDDAILEYREAIRLEPKIPRLHSNLAICLGSKWIFDEALAEHHKAIQLLPQAAYAHYALGATLANMGRLDESTAESHEAIRLNPKETKAQFNLGVGLFLTGKLEEAESQCRKTIGLDPRSAYAHGELGFTLEELGKPDEAIAEFREALRLKPEEIGYRNRIGDILHEKGLADDANHEYQAEIAASREALRRKPNDADKLCRLARLFVTCADNDLRNPQEAVTLAKKALELQPLDGDISDVLALAHYRTGDYAKAREALLHPPKYGNRDERTLHFILAMCEWRLGNQEAARRCYLQGVNWLEQRPQIVAGPAYRFKTEAEQLLGIAKLADPVADESTEK
jgi:Flp pilus assembly protein TadD